MCLSIGNDGEVLVRAPLRTSDKDIEKFVLKHERWIATRLERLKNRRTLSLQNGEKLVLFGEEYEIGTGKACIRKGCVFLPENNRGSAFLRLLGTLAKEKIAPLVEETASRYGFSYSAVRISSARARWGSCNKKGVLAFTRFLAFVKPELVFYVVVHELAHTRYFNHGKNFWREVENILPDWRSLRARLRAEEDCLNFLDKRKEKR